MSSPFERERAPFIGVALAIVVGAGAVCTSTPNAPLPSSSASGGGADASGGSTSSGSSTSVPLPGDDAGFVCNPYRPAVIPDDWLPWTEWACNCPLWYPSPTSAPSAPLTWEPCAVTTVPGIDCRTIRIDWPWDGKTLPMGVYPVFDPGPDGKGVLAFTRNSIAGNGSVSSWRESAVADVDGPVRFVLRQWWPDEPGCLLSEQGVHEGRFAFAVRGEGSGGNALDSPADGLIWGEVGDPTPRLAPLKNDDAAVWSWTGGKGWWVQAVQPSPVTLLYATDFASSKVLYDETTDPDFLPLGLNLPRVLGSDVLFTVGNYSMVGIMAYDVVRGTHPLVRWYGDLTRGATNVGSDGKQIVWSQGEGKIPDQPLYPIRSIMVSDYTTDPAALTPKRLRSDPDASVGLNNFAVGCGYAAHLVNGPRMIIVRIADGVSWQLPGGIDLNWQWTAALGITCDEVFASVVQPKLHLSTVARVKLASLGPGTPPD